MACIVSGRELSDEIKKLRSLQEEGLFCNAKYDKNSLQNTPGSSQVGSELQNELAIPRKRRKSLEADEENMDPQCGDDQHGKSAAQGSADRLPNRSSGSFSDDDLVR